MRKNSIGVIGLKGLPAFGGAAAVGENIIEQLKTNYDFTVYSTASHTDKKSSDLDGYSQIVFKKIPFKKLNTLYYYIISTLHALFFRKYDLIHLHHRDAAFLIPLLRFRYKVLLTTHGRSIVDKWKRYEWFFRMQEKLFVQFADQLICVSKNEVSYYYQAHGICAKHIPNGMYSSSGSMKFAEKVASNDYLFFGAGRIVQSKGCVTMLKALKKMRYSGEVLIAGSMDHSRKHTEEILNEAPGLNVRFLGLIKEKDALMEYMRKATLFLFPSNMEAMSMMLLEAASVKVPVICSDIQENMDIFTKNEVLFFRTDDIDDLAEKIEWALSHPAKMREFSEAAYRKLSTKYTWEVIADQYKNEIEKLIAK